MALAEVSLWSLRRDADVQRMWCGSAASQTPNCGTLQCVQRVKGAKAERPFATGSHQTWCHIAPFPCQNSQHSVSQRDFSACAGSAQYCATQCSEYIRSCQTTAASQRSVQDQATSWCLLKHPTRSTWFGSVTWRSPAQRAGGRQPELHALRTSSSMDRLKASLSRKSSDAGGADKVNPADWARQRASSGAPDNLDC